MLYIYTKANNIVLKKYYTPVFKKYPCNHVVLPVVEDLSKLTPMNKGDVLQICGKYAMEQFKEAGWLPKNKGIESFRKKPIITANGIIVMCTYDVMLLDIDYSAKQKIQWDCIAAIRNSLHGHSLPKLGKYIWVNDLEDLVSYVSDRFDLTNKPVPVVLDLETVGLTPHYEDKYIVCLQTTYKRGSSDCIHFSGKLDQPIKAVYNAKGVLTKHVKTRAKKAIQQQLLFLLTDKRIALRGANLKFDLGWIKEKWGIYCTNFKMDTTLVGSLLDENRSNSLEMHSKIYTELGGYDDQLNQKYDKGRMDLIPKEDLLPYAAGDTDACYRVAETFKSQLLKQPKLARFYTKILHPAARAFETIEQRGVLVDLDKYRALDRQLIRKLAECTNIVKEGLNKQVLYKHIDDFRLTRKSIITDFLFTPLGLNLKPKMTTPTGKVSSTLEHLKMFQDDPDAGAVIKAFSEYTATSKTKSTYVDGFLKHLRPDNKFHSGYMLFKGDYNGKESGTITGRLSAKDPAFQCQPDTAYVLTKTGYLTVKAIRYLIDTGQPPLVLCHDGSYQTMYAWHDNGEQPIYRITTNSGKVLDCTGNHPVLTSKGFIPAGSLRTTQYVYILHRNGWFSACIHKLKMVLRDQAHSDTHAAEKAGFVLDGIANIEILAPKHTYGLSVKNSHTYVSNDVVVHNTIPKHTVWAKPLREVYIAPKGMKVLNLDYSQGELRVCACVANEPTMIAAYNNGIDVHKATAAQVVGMPLPEFLAKAKADPAWGAEKRQGGKAGNFGLIYGMQAEGFCEYAQSTYGVAMSLQESYAFRNTFFGTYKRLGRWHDEVTAFADRWGYVDSPLGRRRHLPLVHSRNFGIKSKQLRQAINSPVQSTLSDLTLYAIHLLTAQYPDLWIFGMTHDSISMYVPEDEIELWAKRGIEVMENLPLESVFGWKPQVNFDADAEVGDNFAHLTELKF